MSTNTPLSLFKNTYHIKSSRLETWDYSSPGWYFVTVAAKDKRCYFGKMVKDRVVLNEIGNIVKEYWKEIPKHYPQTRLDEFIVMPNHIHGIIIIENSHSSIVETGQCPVSTNIGKITKNTSLLGIAIGSFKSACSKEIHKNYINFAWQPLFYDHIIRNEKSLEAIRTYIRYNTRKWLQDELYAKQNPFRQRTGSKN